MTMAMAYNPRKRRYKAIKRPDEWHSFVTPKYKDPSLRAATRDMTEHYTENKVEMSSHFLMDATLMFYEDWQSLPLNPNANNTWKDIVEREYETDAFKNLNKKTSHNKILAEVAARNMVDAIIKESKKAQKALTPPPPQNQGQQGNQPGQNPQGQGQGQNPQGQQGQQGQGQQPFNFNQFMNALQAMANGNAGSGQVAQQVLNGVGQAISQATQQSQDMSDTLTSFSHSGVPMKRTGDPEEMREVLANKVVVDLAKVMKKLATDNLGKSTTKPSPLKGLPLGVKKMSSHLEIPDIITSAYSMDAIDHDLFSYNVMSKNVPVIERFASMNKYLVYIDKSGSMGFNGVKFGNLNVSALAAACGCALNLAMTMLKEGGEMVLKLFDSEVQEPTTDLWSIMKVLATIKEDGGTNITKVLDDIAVYGRDFKTVIMSDGIDEIEESAAMAVKNLDVTSILINEESPILEKYTKVIKVNKFTGDNFLLDL